MEPLFANELFDRLFNTAITTVITIMLYYLLRYLIQANVQAQRLLLKYKRRLSYIFSFILVFLIAKIWVEGFIHLFALLGFVSAALVITQKEGLMNLTGGILISWRDLFAEHDLIQVQTYQGYVKSIGLFYVTLQEVSVENKYIPSGKTIKLPNSLVFTQAVFNYSHPRAYIANYIRLCFKHTAEINTVSVLCEETMQNVIQQHYPTASEENKFTKKPKQTASSKNFDLTAAIQVFIEPSFAKFSHLAVTIVYYANPQDVLDIEKAFWTQLYIALQAPGTPELAIIDNG
jgi:hypothetical protein